MIWLQKIFSFLKKNEKIVSFVALGIGFIVDSLTLQRIDLFFENLVIILYLTIVAGSIFYIHLSTSRNYIHPHSIRIRIVTNLLLQYAFGGLFSAFIIFYTRSASVLLSWPFLLLLLVILLSSEFFRKYYERLSIHLTMFFLCIFSYSIFLVPILLGEISVRAFFISSIVSLVFVSLYIALLYITARAPVEKSLRYVILFITSVLVLIYSFYYFRLLPPIPLSLYDIQVAQNVQRQEDGTYLINKSDESFMQSLVGYSYFSPVVVGTDQQVYVYASVFSPTRISGTIKHVWQKKGENGWQTVDTIQYRITGGRDAGYRGYSRKSNIDRGNWRVLITTATGHEIGRAYIVVE
jgi:hypothetical protein